MQAYLKSLKLTSKLKFLTVKWNAFWRFSRYIDDFGVLLYHRHSIWEWYIRKIYFLLSEEISVIIFWKKGVLKSILIENRAKISTVFYKYYYLCMGINYISYEPILFYSFPTRHFFLILLRNFFVEGVKNASFIPWTSWYPFYKYSNL